MHRLMVFSVGVLFALTVVSGFAPLNAQLAPVSAKPGVPEQLKPTMDAAFKAGNTYFVWTSNTVVRGTVGQLIGSLVSFKVQVLAGSPQKAPRYRVYTTVLASSEETKEITKYTTTFPGKTEDANKYTPGVPDDVYLFVRGGTLKGSGVAMVYLIPAEGKSEDATPISNTLEVKVEF